MAYWVSYILIAAFCGESLTSRFSQVLPILALVPNSGFLGPLLKKHLLISRRYSFARRSRRWPMRQR